jgi:hypothetical protein
LCEEALQLLHQEVARIPSCRLTLQEIDIDQDAELISRYGDKVPVLVIAGKERLWGKINPVWLHRTLEAEAARLRKAQTPERSSADQVQRRDNRAAEPERDTTKESRNPGE